MAKKYTLEEIFADDEFGLLDVKPKVSNVKSEDDRLIDSFEEINAFIDKYEREPNTSSMSEYSLLAKLKTFRNSEDHKVTLKPFDRHNLLGNVEIKKKSLDDIFAEDDSGLLGVDTDLSIFQYKHTPTPEERAEADFVAQRKPMKEKDFAPYEKMFQQVHKEIKEGSRKVKIFNYEALREKRFYVQQGVVLYLEGVDWERDIQSFNSGIHNRPDGRCNIIFENGTKSNMMFQSLYKSLHPNGKYISETDESIENGLFVQEETVGYNDVATGWVYVLKSRSNDPQISSIDNLYKIGFSSTPVDERIKNAKNEATYLFADVQKVAEYRIYNRDAHTLEGLVHRVFAKACLNVDIEGPDGQKMNPREWFVVPFDVIDQAIPLILNENILAYEYDDVGQVLRLK